MKKTLKYVSIALLTSMLLVGCGQDKGTKADYSQVQLDDVDLGKQLDKLITPTPVPTVTPTETLAPIKTKKPVSIKKMKKVKIYAKTSVHIRARPNKKSKSITVLHYGQSVERIKKMKNWSKVIYKGKIRYVKNKYFTKHKMIEKLGSYTDYRVTGPSSFKSQEPSYMITTSSSSPQGRLHQQYYTDSKSGICMVKGRYCIAVGSYYAKKIGTKIDLFMRNGKVIKCILADQKADEDTVDNHTRHRGDGSIVEVVVNYSRHVSVLRSKFGTNTGNAGDALKGFDGAIKKIRVYK